MLWCRVLLAKIYALSFSLTVPSLASNSSFFYLLFISYCYKSWFSESSLRCYSNFASVKAINLLLWNSIRLSVCMPVSSKFLNKSRLSISKSHRSHTLTSSDWVCDTYRFVSLHTSHMDLAQRLQCISGFRFIRTSFLVNCASQSSQALLGTRFSFIPFMSTNSGRLRRCLGTGPFIIDDFDSRVNTSPIFEKKPPGVTSVPDRG